MKESRKQAVLLSIFDSRSTKVTMANSVLILHFEAHDVVAGTIAVDDQTAVQVLYAVGSLKHPWNIDEKKV